MINKKLLVATTVTALFLGGCLDSATGESQREANGDTSMLKVEKVVVKQEESKSAPAQKAAAPAGGVDTTACAACHGVDFEKKAMGVSKIVKDLTGVEIVTALNGYKDGSYGAGMKAIMKGQVAGLDAASIDAIAAKISGASAPKAEEATPVKEEAPKAEEATPAKEEAPKAEEATPAKEEAPVAPAVEVNTATCAGCHGTSFEKKAMNVSKVVNELSKADIVTALKGYKDGTYGGGMKALMKGQVAALSDADIEAIANKFGK